MPSHLQPKWRHRCHEYYAIHRSNPEGWDVIIDWTKSPEILLGEPNQLKVFSERKRLFLFINDHFITQVDALQILNGQVGIVAGLNNPGDEITVVFDDFELHAPYTSGEYP